MNPLATNYALYLSIEPSLIRLLANLTGNVLNEVNLSFVGRERMSRERNTGWERVRTRGKAKTSDRVRLREDPCRSYVGNRNGQQQSYNRANWRDQKDIASFYFIRFPEDAIEKDLWYHFKKLGDVREIFISKQRNKNGRRYGFARLKGVEDVRSLERKLDNIVLGGLKLYVNIPKFGRDTVEKIILEAKRMEHDEQNENEAP